MRRFVGLKLSGALPDETTILNFRHLLERHSLGEGLLLEINAHLDSQGLWLREGTIVDASIIEAPSSTKNRAGERDPAMHQTKKGNQWHFGMKVHIGVDADTGLVHSMSATAANVHDVTEAHNLLHGGEKVVWCDAGYQGVQQREENLGLKVDWQVAMRPGKRRKLEPGSDEAVAEKEKASVRAKSLPSTTIGGGASLPGRRQPLSRDAGVRVRLFVRVRDVLSVVDQGTHGHSQFFRYLPKGWNQESALSVQNLVEPVAGMTQCGGHRIRGSSPPFERGSQVPGDNGIDG